MSTASLLTMPADPAARAMFWFEEAMTHRRQLGAMAPLNRFSVLPYFIDPFRPNTMWLLTHQQAQNDANTTMPTWSETPPPTYPGTLNQSVPLTQNLIDVNLNDQRQRAWWTFANHREQLIAMDELPPVLTFPFW
jgi:hypothetical protein